MLSGNFCDRELQTNNIEWGSGVFSTIYRAIKRVVFFGTLKVLLKDNVSTNYVADCRHFISMREIHISMQEDTLLVCRKGSPREVQHDAYLC